MNVEHDGRQCSSSRRLQKSAAVAETALSPAGICLNARVPVVKREGLGGDEMAFSEEQLRFIVRIGRASDGTHTLGTGILIAPEW